MAKGHLIKRMIGGASSICPPGFLCMDTGFVMIVIVILLVLFIGVYLHTRNNDLHEIKKIVSGIEPNDSHSEIDKKYILFKSPI